MALPAGMETALGQGAALIFYALELELESGTLRLLAGDGEVTFDGNTYRGSADEGVIQGLAPIEDGMDDEAPSWSFTILPPSVMATVDLAAPTVQGRPARLWFGCANVTTGVCIGEPYLLIEGEIDVPNLTVGEGSRVLSMEVVSVFERLFEDLEGVRLNDNWHQTDWSGELGLEFVTDILRSNPWGVDAPRPGSITDTKTAVQGVLDQVWK